jgi:hypothetical protein
MIDDGGPAFPIQFDMRGEGMTLRDYFAAAAMQGWLASYGDNTGHPSAEGFGCDVARLSYEMAESMLKHRAALT